MDLNIYLFFHVMGWHFTTLLLLGLLKRTCEQIYRVINHKINGHDQLIFQRALLTTKLTVTIELFFNEN